MAAESSLLIPDYPLTVLPNLAVQIGLNEAIFLQQVRYWMTREAGFCDQYGRRWIYNTVKQWRDQFPFWSESTIKRTIRSLEEQNALLSTTVGDAFNKTKAYTINFDRIEELAEKIVHEQRCASIESVQRCVSAPPPKRKHWEYPEEPTVSDGIETEYIAPAATENDIEGQNIKVGEPIEEVKMTQHTVQNDPLEEVNLTRSNRPPETPTAARFCTSSSRTRVTETTTTENTHRIRETTTGDVRSLCAALGISDTSTENFLRRYGEECVYEKARLLEIAMQTQSIRNPTGWLHAALKNGYMFSPNRPQQEEQPVQRPKVYVPPPSVTVSAVSEQKSKPRMQRDLHEFFSQQADREGSAFAQEYLRRHGIEGRASP